MGDGLGIVVQLEEKLLADLVVIGSSVSYSLLWGRMI